MVKIINSKHHIHNMYVRFVLSVKYQKNLVAILRPSDILTVLRQFVEVLTILGQDPQLQISYLWLTNLIRSECQIHSIGICFIFGIKFSWNEVIHTCFNAECVLLGHNFNFLGGCLVVTSGYLVVTGCYWLLLGGYWWLLLVIGGYCLLPLITARSHF